MKEVTILGAYGGANVGDEYILISILQAIRRRVKSVTVSAGLQVEPTSSWRAWYVAEGLRVALPIRTFRFLANVLISPLLIVGGGQLLGGGHQRKGLIYYALIALLRRCISRPTILVGVGVGDLTSALDRCFIRLLAICSSEVYVRDIHSYSEMLKIHPSRKIQKFADAVFSQDTKSVAKIADISIKNPTIIFVVHPLDDPSKVAAMIAEVICVVRSCCEADIILLHHDLRDWNDSAVSNLVKEKDMAVSVVQPQSLQEVDAIYNSADFVITMRMHPILLGLIHQKKVLVLAHSKKIVQAAEELELQNILVNGRIDRELVAMELQDFEPSKLSLELFSRRRVEANKMFDFIVGKYF